MGNCMGKWNDFLGEGTIILNQKTNSSFRIEFRSTSRQDLNTPLGTIVLVVNPEGASLDVKCDNRTSTKTTQNGIIDDGDDNLVIAYWLSFNRDDRELKYGRGYVMEETTYMTWKASDNNWGKWDDLFNPENIRQVRVSAELLGSEQTMDVVAKRVDIYPYPLTKNWPYLVKDSSIATMSVAADPDILLSGNLPSTCRELYAIVAPLELDPKLSDAIKNSLEKGNYLDGLLQKKKDDNVGDEDKKESMSDYLRITLGNGSDCGSAPRHLEVWKPQAGSAIHNHGNAYGVIKVVHGEIKIEVYNRHLKRIDEDRPLLSFTARAGDVTWLSPNWYQTHRLVNNSKDEYCATIQCYKYGKDDSVMWPYFDYLKDSQDHSIGEFKRGDDVSFNEMYDIVMREYKLGEPILPSSD